MSRYFTICDLIPREKHMEVYNVDQFLPKLQKSYLWVLSEAKWSITCKIKQNIKQIIVQQKVEQSTSFENQDKSNFAVDCMIAQATMCSELKYIAQ